MAILGKFEKQPHEILDYDVDFTEWFAGRSDSAVSVEVLSSDVGITIISAVILTGPVVKIVLSGGTDGVIYKITVRLTTSAGLIREADFNVSVKET